MLERREYQHSMMGFQSHRHQLFTVKRTKKSLRPFDDKRFILEDGYTTRAHGHWRNGIARPQIEKVTTPELIESMGALSLSNEPSTTHRTDLTDIAFPEPYTVLPPGSQNSSPNAFYSYLNSFW